MLKRLAILVAAVAGIALTGCSCPGSYCGGSIGCIRPHCEPPCYCCSLQRDTRQIMDVIDVHFLNYDRHDPFRCDPCIGD